MTASKASAPLDIRLEKVSKGFAGAGDALAVLQDINVHVPGGQTAAIVGPSGCGKSTLLRIIAGLETADAGTISLSDAPPLQRRAEKQVSVAFQEDALLPWRSLEGNVALGRRLANMRADPHLVASLIEQVGLSGFEKKRPAELSGGMRQRAAIARCLATKPSVLLLDEPFGAVDALTRRRLNIELPPVWGAGQTTVLMVTHSVTEAVLLSDQIIVLSPRPARVVDRIDVNLPRPRRAEMLDTDAFTAFVRKTEQTLARAENALSGDALSR